MRGCEEKISDFDVKFLSGMEPSDVPELYQIYIILCLWSETKAPQGPL